MTNRSRYLVLSALLLPALVLVGYYGVYDSRGGRETSRNVTAFVETFGEKLNRIDRNLRPVSDREERALGAQIAARMESRFPLVDEQDERLRYVRTLGNVLSSGTEKSFDYQFHVIRSGMVNAMALPGGYVYVTTGMLDLVRSEAELAGVLAHEIGHVELNHCEDLVRSRAQEMPSVTRLLELFVRASFDQAQEKEADLYSVQLTQENLYSPIAAADLFHRMLDRRGRHPETEADEDGNVPGPHRSPGELIGEALDRFLATHPGLKERTEYIRREGKREARDAGQSRYYRGEWNVQHLTPRLKEMKQDEWIQLEQ